MTSTSKLLSITPRLKIQRVPKANLHGHSLNQKTLIRERHCWLRVKNVEYVCYQIRPFLHKLSSGLYKTRLKYIKNQTSLKLSLCVSFRAMHQIMNSIANLIKVDLRFIYTILSYIVSYIPELESELIMMWKLLNGKVSHLHLIAL